MWTSEPPGPAELIIIGGQSNALSHGLNSSTPAEIAAIDINRVKVWDGSAFVGYVAGGTSEPTNAAPGKWGPEAQYAVRWLNDNAQGTLYIVKRGVSGTAIATWRDGQPNFDDQEAWCAAAKRALERAGASLLNAPRILWLHGESDSIVNADTSHAYQSQLRSFITEARNLWGSASSPIVITRLHDANMPFRAPVRAAQNNVAVDDPLVYLVDTDDQTLVDSYHYDTAGIIAVGNRLYDAAVNGSSIENADTEIVAPSAPSGSATGTTTASISAAPNEANGTLYFVVTTSSTAPSAAQVKAGQDSAGATAAFSESQIIHTIGRIPSVPVGNLSAGTTYYAHFMQEDLAGNQSARVTSAPFTTDALSYEPVQSLPPMTSNTAPAGHVASASAEFSAAYAAWKAFDQLEFGSGDSFRWATTSPTAFPCWVQRQTPSAIAVGGYRIRAHTSFLEFSPEAFEFQGSNDGTNWTTLDSRSGQLFAAGEIKEYNVTLDNRRAYTRHRLQITAVKSGSACTMVELQLLLGTERP
jgi:hypothetical protein